MFVIRRIVLLAFPPRSWSRTPSRTPPHAAADAPPASRAHRPGHDLLRPKNLTAAAFAACALLVPAAAAHAAPTAVTQAAPTGTALATAVGELAHGVLVGHDVRLARKAARLGGPRLTHARRAHLESLGLRALGHERRRLSGRIDALRAQAAKVAKVAGTLAKIRACESGGDYGSNTGNGFYGAYQFDRGTWQSVGGSGVASDASPAEQDARAAALLERSGSSPWPVCGR